MGGIPMCFQLTPSAAAAQVKKTKFLLAPLERGSYPGDNRPYGSIYLADEVSFPSVGLKWVRAPVSKWFAGGSWRGGSPLSTTVCRSRELLELEHESSVFPH